MAAKKSEEVELIGQNGPVPEVEAITEQGTPLVLDAKLFVEALKTVSAGLKQLGSLFNPVDSRGDLFVNQLALLDNQIAGLVSQVEDAE